MPERWLALLAPCRIGWLLVASMLMIYSFATHHRALLLVVLAPLSGSLLGAWLTGQTSHCDVRPTRACTGSTDE